MIKNIVFDMGGVLIDYDSDSVLEKYFPKEYHAVLNEKIFKSNVWARLDEGTEFVDDILDGIVSQLPVEVRSLAGEMLYDFYPYMPPFDDMFEFVKRVKASGYQVYLLSNATPRFFDRYQDIPALSLMDGFFISSLYKLLKPDRRIYEAFCNKFSLIADECFFIDDVARNIEGARDYGMQGYVYKKHDIAGLEKALADVSVIIK